MLVLDVSFEIGSSEFSNFELEISKKIKHIQVLATKRHELEHAKNNDYMQREHNYWPKSDRRELNEILKLKCVS